jgi:hypothetical protein
LSSIGCSNIESYGAVDKVIRNVSVEEFVPHVHPDYDHQSVSFRSDKDDEYMSKNDAINLVENSINYIYAVPFTKYDDFHIVQDTIQLNISDCTVSHDSLAVLYSEIWFKVNCQFQCTHLEESSKKIKIVDLEKLDSINCSDNQIIVRTIIGTESAKVDYNIHDWQNEHFTNEELYALCANCEDTQSEPMADLNSPYPFSYPNCAPYEISILASNNFNHIDYYHTFQDIENLFPYQMLLLPQNVHVPDAVWWNLNCQWEFGTQNSDFWPQDCLDYFEDGEYHSPWSNLTDSVGEGYCCLSTDELNDYLEATEDASHQLGDQYDKHPVHIYMYPRIYGTKFFTVGGDWTGTLPLGTKVYRDYPHTEPQESECLCF